MKKISSLFLNIFLLFLSILSLYFLFQVKAEQSQIQNSKTIVTTTTILRDAVKHLIGQVDFEEDKDKKYQKIDSFNKVISLMGVGTDPHNYRAKPSDRQKIKDAAFVIYHGLHLESQMVSTFNKIKDSDKIWNTGDYLKQKYQNSLIKDEDDSTEYDPHIWFDIDLWLSSVEGLKEKIKSLIPSSHEDIEKIENNFVCFKKKLEELKIENINKFTKLKETLGNKFIIVTSHDAFSYWQKFCEKNNCSFEFKCLQGISTQEEVSLFTINQIAKEIPDEAKAFFKESSTSPRILDGLRERVNYLRRQKNKQIEEIKIPENIELYSDSLGNDYKSETLNNISYKHSTYIGAFLNNINIIELLNKI